MFIAFKYGCIALLVFCKIVNVYLLIILLFIADPVFNAHVTKVI